MPIVNETEHEFLRSTYKDNCFLSAAEIASIECQRCNAPAYGDPSSPQTIDFLYHIGRPKKANDHAIDAMRYVISSPKPKKLLFA